VLPAAEFKVRSLLQTDSNGLPPRSMGLRFTSKPIPTPNFTQKPPNPGKQYHTMNAVGHQKHRNSTKKAVCYTI